MNVVLDLREAQCAELQELITTLRVLCESQCCEFGSTMSQRAAAGESVAKLNAESHDRMRRISTFTQANLLRVAVEDFMLRMKAHPEQIIELFEKSELVRFRGNPNHRKLVLPALPLKPQVAVTRRKY